MKKFILFNLCLLFFIPSLACGEEPLELFNIKPPNVTVIFDTSSSMERSPDGKVVDSSKVRVDSEGNVVTTGGTQYKFAGGANHPNSKLYQAKLALKKVIKNIVKDKVNLGFATYAQFKQQQIVGYYKRQIRYWVPPVPAVPNKWQCCRREGDQWQCCRSWTTPGTCNSSSYSHSGPSKTVSPCSASCPGGWSDWHTFETSCTSSYTGSLSYSNTSSSCNTEYNEKTCTYASSSHAHYYTSGGGTSTQCQNYTINPGSCSSYCSGYESCSGPTLILGPQVCQTYTFRPTSCSVFCGSLPCTGPTFIPGSPEIPGYWGSWQTEYSWISLSDLSCPLTYGSDYSSSTVEYTKWTRVDPPQCYDLSDYIYPADGTTNKPHTWSYFKMDGGNWPENKQTPNYYPSVDGSGNFNNTPGAFNNHYFFINFPDDKDPAFTPAMRTAIKDQVLSLMDLTPVKFPGSGSSSGGLPGDWEFDEYYTKLPMHANHGRTGLTSNTQFAKFTPLADSLKYSYKYYYDFIYNYKGGDPASKIVTTEGIPCRGNYIILLTDGLESARFLDAQQQQPDYGAAPLEAANLLTIGVRTFVIGFGTDIVGNDTINNIAKAGGTEQAYYAPDYAGLEDSLGKIFRAILSAQYARSNPVVTRERDRIYRAYFEITPDEYYKGHMEARSIDKNGDIINPKPQPPNWDAGIVMRDLGAQGRGKVYTWTANSPNPQRLDFLPSTSLLYSPVNFVNPLGEDIDGNGSVNDNDAKTVINFTLDPNYDDGISGHGAGYYKGKREPDWKLGDIFHSTPVVIGAPAFLFTENNYQTFYNTNINREKMIYAGANDGMLHGFRASDGREIFSIIPKNLLGKLKNLKSTHNFYVDSSPKAYDVYFNGPPIGPWRTILISGQMSGGPYYFAVDVTNPVSSEYPKILWEWTDSNMGDSWGKPDIGKVNIGGTKKFVAFFTGGYSTTNDKGNRFYVVDIETGATIKKFTVGDATNKIPSGPKTFDFNGDGLVDYVYFGDIKGTVWKVDVSSPSTNPASKRKPIFYSPEVTKNDEGKILVYFGTGEELNLTAVPVTNYFWEIWDDKGNGKLVPPGKNWPKELSNQKILASPFMANRVIFFTTWEYPGPGGIQQDLCGVGLGRLYGYKMSMAGVEGGQAGLVTLDSGGNPKTQESLTLGIGIPSAPIITNGRIYTSSSVNSPSIVAIKTPLWDTTGNIRAWREMF